MILIDYSASRNRTFFYLLILSLALPYSLSAQSIKKYRVDEIYEAIELKDGALDEDGNSISVIYVPTDLDQGRYEVTIKSSSYGSSNLYHVEGTGYYITFQSYYGYIGYGGDQGILDIGYSDWERYFFKFDD